VIFFASILSWTFLEFKILLLEVSKFLLMFWLSFCVRRKLPWYYWY